MRRKDREVTDENEVDKIISESFCCRLGLIDNGVAYILPLNFGFDYEGEERVFYFHSALVGRKVELMKQNSTIGFELDTRCELEPTEFAQDCTSKYASVIGVGELEIIEDFEGKIYCLNKLLENYREEKEFNLPERIVNQTLVFKLKVKSLSCKQNG